MSTFINSSKSANAVLTSKVHNEQNESFFTNLTRGVKFLWVSTTFPWQESLPWQIDGTGNAFTLTTKH